MKKRTLSLFMALSLIFSTIMAGVVSAAETDTKELKMNVYNNGSYYRLYPVDWEITRVEAADQDGKDVPLIENRGNSKPQDMVLFGYNKYVSGTGFLPEMTSVDVFKNGAWKEMTVKVYDAQENVYITTLANERYKELKMNIYDNGSSFRIYPVNWEIVKVKAIDQDGKEVPLVENRANSKPQDMVLFGHNKYVSGTGFLPEMTALDVYKNGAWKEITLTAYDAMDNFFTTVIVNNKYKELKMNVYNNGSYFRIYPVDWEITKVKAVDQNGKDVPLIENRANNKPADTILFGYNKYVAGQGFLPEMTALDVYKTSAWKEITLKVYTADENIYTAVLVNDSIKELKMNVYDNGSYFRLYPVNWEIASVSAVDQDGIPVPLVENRANNKPADIVLFGYNKYVAGQGFLPEMTSLDVFKRESWQELTLTIKDADSTSYTVTLSNPLPEQAKTPEAVLDRDTMILSNVTDRMEYSLDGGETWAAITGTTVDLSEQAISPSHGIMVRDKGDGKNIAMSDVQTIAFALEVASIAITTVPVSVAVVYGSTPGVVDKTGGVLTVTYEKSDLYPTETIDMTDDGVVCGEVNTSVYGSQTIAVTYGGKSADMNVVVVPENTKRIFTFNSGVESVQTESGTYKVTKTVINEPDGVLKVDFKYNGGYETVKLVMPTTAADAASYRASTHIKYDLLLSKADVDNPINSGATFGVVICTPQNGWWKQHGRMYSKSDMTVYNDDFYILTVDADITDSTFGRYPYTSGVFYVQPLADKFTSQESMYLNNIIFYAIPVPVESITFDQASVALSAGATAVLKPTVLPANAYNKSLIWSSSDESKVTVDQNGKITAVSTAIEPVIITATSADGGVTGTCLVTVAPPVLAESVTLDVTSATLKAGWGKTAKTTATVLPADTSDKTIIWTSSDESVAKVRNGVITAIGEGSATITATAKDSNGGVFATCEVTIEPTPVVNLGDGSRSIKVDGTQFVVGNDNKPIWINGANTPWNNWDEFGGGNTFNPDWWRNHFAQLSENGVNATRVWLLCSGDYGIQFDKDGYVTGMTDAFWDNVGTLLEIAKENGIYIMATAASFDCFSSQGHTGTTWNQWRAMIQDSDKIDSYVENYIIPLVNRFDSSDYLWSIDICNEIDWVHEEERCGQLPWSDISNFIARQTVGIHQNSDVLVTAGMASSKYSADPSESIGVGDIEAYEGNKIADSYLQSFIDNDSAKQYARVDFYSSHYYGWQAPWFGNPFSMTPAQYAYTDGRPALIGETPAIGSGWSHMYADESTNWQGRPSPGAVQYTLLDDYTNALANGFSGVMPWSSNGIDGAGKFSDLIKATAVIAEKYPDLIFPLGKTAEVLPAAMPEAVFDAITMILSNVTAQMEYSLDGGASWITITGETVDLSKEAVSVEFGIQVRDKGDGTTSMSEVQMIPFAKANAPSGVSVSYATGRNVNGTINGVTSDMEYKLTTESVYKPITGSTLTNCAPGNYQVRYKAIDGNAASDPVTVTVEIVKRSFTFSASNTDSITGDSAEGGATWTSGTKIARANINGGLLQINAKFNGGYVKLIMPTSSNYPASYAEATHLRYDVLLKKEDVDANPNAAFYLRLSTSSVSWDDSYAGNKYTKTDMTLVNYGGVEYYKFTVDNNITANKYLGSGYFYILPVASSFVSNGPIYMDNVLFYVPYKDPVAVTGVSVESSITLDMGTTQALTANVSPQDATNKTVIWSSSDESVATVNSSGLITAKMTGEAIITATTVDGGFTAQCTVTVNPKVLAESVSLNITATEFNEAGRQTLIATVSPANTTDKSVTWTSSDPSVVSVSYNGIITAIKGGTAIVTVTTENGLEATCTVSVNIAPVSQDILNKKIRVDGARLVVGPEDKEIWINGVNTPWMNWDEFGGTFDYARWDTHFAALHAAGVNASRIWLICSGDNGVTFDENGYFVGVTDKVWENLDKLFEIAAKNEIYIMATPISFDAFKNANKNYQQWRGLIQGNDKDIDKATNMDLINARIDSYNDNFIIPFVARYGNNPYLWSIDLCNEPDWIFENAECGQIPFEYVSNFLARSCVAIHEVSDVLVTVGMGSIKYNSDDYGSQFQGNKISDAYLGRFVNSPYAKVDFYSTHYYGWQWPYYSSPFERTPVAFGLEPSKPAVIGEMWGSGQDYGSVKKTLTENYVDAYEKGYKGIMAWTSNIVGDGAGGLDKVTPATLHMLGLIPELVFPLATTVVTDEEKVADAVSALDFAAIQGANAAIDNITTDLTLSMTGLHNASINWSSSNQAVITNEGVVTRPQNGEGDAVVTMRATITCGNASQTVEFVLTVKEMEPVAPPDGSVKLAFTFDSDTEGITEEFGSVVRQAMLGGEGVLEVNFNGFNGGWNFFKLILPKDMASIALYKDSTHLSYDIIIPKAAIDANQNTNFGAVLPTSGNGGWNQYSLWAGKNAMIEAVYGGETYYVLPVELDISGDMAKINVSSGAYVILGIISDGLTYSGPVYIDNIIFKAIDNIIPEVEDEKPVVTHTVTLDSGDGYTTTQNVNDGETTICPADPVREGYTFLSWYLDGAAFDFNTSVTSDVTLVAQWEKEIVIIPITSVKITTTSLTTLVRGKSLQINYTLNEGASASDLVWSVSNAALAAVDQNGLVKANGSQAGNVIVTAQSKDGKVTASVLLKIIN